MILLDLLHTALSLDVQGAFRDSPGACDATACPGSAVSAIAAAYGTQGIWVLADLTEQFLTTSLGALGPLLYVVAAIGGLISVALGAPPKTYMWFFLGPAIYRWLIGTTTPVVGMAWQMGGRFMDQREVWRLSEVGLTNTNMALKNPWAQFSSANLPTESVEVPLFFVYYDQLISGTVQGLIQITGQFRARPSTTGGANSSLPTELPTTGVEDGGWGDKWFLVSSRKWSTIQDITDARVQNPHLRIALTRYFAGECGDTFASVVNPTRFINAMYGKGKSSPASVFQTDASGPNVDGGGSQYQDSDYYGRRYTDPLDQENYTQTLEKLRKRAIPFPREIRKMLDDDSDGGYRQFINITDTTSAPGLTARPGLTCEDTLKFIIAGFRWEASKIFVQIMSGLPISTTPEDLVYNLLYGWNIRKGGTDISGARLSLREQAYFVQDLVFVHLVRNEMMLARSALKQSQVNPNQISSRITSDGAEGHLRFVAVKNKSSELYQWATMLPHMQGILLYYLAIGYPFACVMLILPGMHKTLFTWMSFWAWAKLWDLGFAIVLALERSVWAMLGSNATIGAAFSKIASMQNWGRMVDGGSRCTNEGFCIWQFNLQVASADFSINNASHWIQLFKMFDRALAVSANLDLDLQNSYYVYIMSGLYFAVPVVAGQLVLGSKAGMSSLVKDVIGGIGQEAGRQASQGYTGDLQNRIRTNFNAASQAAYGAAQRGSDLLGQAINAGNQAREKGLEGDFLGQRAGLAGEKAALSSLTSQSADKAINQGYASVSGLVGAGKGAVDAGVTFTGHRNAGASRWESLFNKGPNSGGVNGTPTPSALETGGKAADEGLKAFMNGEANRIGQAAYDANAAASIQKQGYNIGSFQTKGQGTQFEVGADRYGKHAEYEAQMAAWEARNAFSSSMAATAAALGGSPGGLEPGNMPQESTGMAMAGEMGEKANSAARWMDPYNSNSGWNQSLGGQHAALAQEQSTLSGYYTGSTPGVLINHGTRNAPNNLLATSDGLLDGKGVRTAPQELHPTSRLGDGPLPDTNQ